LGLSHSTALGLDHAQRIIGIHLNYIAGRFLLGGTLNQAPDDEIANPSSRNSVHGGTLRAAIAMFKVLSHKLWVTRLTIPLSVLRPGSSRSSELGVIALASWSTSSQGMNS
jgi:hypothetical protein